MFEALQQLSRHFLKIKNTSYRRYLIQTTAFKHRLSVVIGQRGVGKTTTLVQCLLDKVQAALAIKFRCGCSVLSINSSR